MEQWMRETVNMAQTFKAWDSQEVKTSVLMVTQLDFIENFILHCVGVFNNSIFDIYRLHVHKHLIGNAPCQIWRQDLKLEIRES